NAAAIAACQISADSAVGHRQPSLAEDAAAPRVAAIGDGAAVDYTTVEKEDCVGPDRATRAQGLADLRTRVGLASGQRRRLQVYGSRGSEDAAAIAVAAHCGREATGYRQVGDFKDPVGAKDVEDAAIASAVDREGSVRWAQEVQRERPYDNLAL